jgi:membrane peptidoglycan carboxypeptidase
VREGAPVSGPGDPYDPATRPFGGSLADTQEFAAQPYGPPPTRTYGDRSHAGGSRADQPPISTYDGRPGGGFSRGSGRGRRWLRRASWVVAFLVTLCLVAFAVLMSATPSVGNAQTIARNQALLHHSPYPGPPVPVKFADALTSTEDHRFGSPLEPGFDPFALGRVIGSGLTHSGDQGGATLYQQLAKMLYAPGQRGLKLYSYELGLGIKLKFTYSSEQILRMYADVAYFGNGFYGIDVASCGYFGRPPDRLSWPQASLLAGLVQAPTDYDPLTHRVLARSREGHVLGRLVATGILTQREASAAFAIPIRRLVSGAGGCRA